MCVCVCVCVVVVVVVVVLLFCTSECLDPGNINVRQFHVYVHALQRLRRSDAWRTASGIETSSTSPGRTTGPVPATR